MNLKLPVTVYNAARRHADSRFVTMGQKQSKVRPSSTEQNILVLGSEGAGKTTMLLRTQQYLKKDISQDHKLFYRGLARSRVIRTVKDILDGMSMSQIKSENPSLIKHLRIIKEYNEDTFIIPEFVADSIEIIANSMIYWKNLGRIKDQSFYYFIENLRRIFSNSYEPTIEDAIHCYRPTADRYEVTVNDAQQKRIIEFGGSRAVRKQCSQEAMSYDRIFFLASANVNQESSLMEDSATFFETICNSRLFSHCEIYLVMTHIDELKVRAKVEGFDYGRALHDLEERYFEIADCTTPVYEVNLLEKKSSYELIQYILSE